MSSRSTNPATGGRSEEFLAAQSVVGQSEENSAGQPELQQDVPAEEHQQQEHQEEPQGGHQDEQTEEQQQQEGQAERQEEQQEGQEDSTVEASDKVPLWMCITVWVLRVAVGGVFVMSGLVKTLDLWGFVYKIEEYLAVWHFVQPRSLVFVAALVISGYEFVLGALLAMGCYKRTAPVGLLLTMAVMLPLTLYVWIYSPVSDCGCFGDFLKISNAATFWKNIVLTAALVLLLRWSPRIKQAMFNPAIQWMVGALITLYALCVGIYGYYAQPMADFRSYPAGTLLADGVGDEDSADYLFIYEKDGERRTFGIDNLPDSTWIFVDRVEPEGEAEPSEPLNPLTVFDSDGDDVTADVFVADGYQLVIVIPEPRRADVAYTYTLNEIYDNATRYEIPIVALLGTGAEGVARWVDMSMAEYPCYSADETQLKELSRGTISMVMLNDGKIISKTTLNSMIPVEVEQPRDERSFLDALSGYGRRWFDIINLTFGGVLLVIYLFQGLILALRAALRAKFRKAYRGNNGGNS